MPLTGAPIVALGFSQGSNSLVHFLGQLPTDQPPPFRAAISVSNAYDLNNGGYSGPWTALRVCLHVHMCMCVSNTYDLNNGEYAVGFSILAADSAPGSRGTRHAAAKVMHAQLGRTLR